MYVNVMVALNEGDSREAVSTASDAEAAEKVLELLGGDPATDTCIVQVTATAKTGPITAPVMLPIPPPPIPSPE